MPTYRKIPKGRYKPHFSLKDDLCWYCERPAEQIDHFPPVSREAEVPQIQGWLVNSCRRCNITLGNMQHISLDSRKFYIQEWLIQKVYIQRLMLAGATMVHLMEISGLSYGRLRTIRDEYRKDKQRQQDKVKFEEEAPERVRKMLDELGDFDGE